MVKSPYCIIAQRGSVCTDSTSSMLDDVIRCKPCNYSFPLDSLQQHESGRQPLCNIKSSGSRLSAPSRTTSYIQHALPANISPPAGVTLAYPPGTQIDGSMSGEDGHDFFVEGSRASENPFFPHGTHNNWIEKTDMSSSLSIIAVTLTPSLG